MSSGSEKPDSARDHLREAWFRTTSEYGIPMDTSEEMRQEIETAYGAPGRYYHNRNHLRRMMQDWNRLRSHFSRPFEVSLAVYYHDFIYVPGESDNEEQSARIAHERLRGVNLQLDAVRRIASMIRATADHRETGDKDTDLFLDMDMAVLAAESREYRMYTEAVRREYGRFTEEAFRIGRRRFLLKLTGRPRIFITGEFQGEPEKRARRNIREELKGLVPE